eukprot:COSAG02_NODE_1905_length_10437_cov_54.532643_3_plen_152_part_00
MRLYLSAPLMLMCWLHAAREISCRPVPFFYVHLLLMISLFYLPLFSYSMALDFDQLDVMCGDRMLAPDQYGAVNISWWLIEDFTVPMSTTNFCSEYWRYEVVGVICVAVQVCLAVHDGFATTTGIFSCQWYGQLATHSISRSAGFAIGKFC